MQDRNLELSELLAAAARMAEAAARHELTVASHLLDLLQLELIKAIYGYSEDESASSEAEPAEPPPKPGRKTARRGRG